MLLIRSSHGVPSWLSFCLGVPVPVLRRRVTVHCVTVYILSYVLYLLRLRLVKGIHPWLNDIVNLLRLRHEADCACHVARVSLAFVTHVTGCVAVASVSARCTYGPMIGLLVRQGGPL